MAQNRQRASGHRTPYPAFTPAGFALNGTGTGTTAKVA